MIGFLVKFNNKDFLIFGKDESEAREYFKRMSGTYPTEIKMIESNEIVEVTGQLQQQAKGK